MSCKRELSAEEITMILKELPDSESEGEESSEMHDKRYDENFIQVVSSELESDETNEFLDFQEKIYGVAKNSYAAVLICANLFYASLKDYKLSKYHFSNV
ncbi:hypothetical protein NPIL_159501 [Nephila pilipes]|uniref:Uncharacterized protein n=1 Tax=Nephila pilipes TaxID=299642 RepID=A0A8X6MZJ9_NEPPI|nr:hypothetical protein NPIL_159501 [Nephila pilipes]